MLQVARHPGAPRGGWQDTIVSTIRSEIDGGLIVRVHLHGARDPVLVEVAGTHGPMVVLSDPAGGRYYVGALEGVVIMAHPLDGASRPSGHARTPRMDVD